jgi:hypothetical protein
LPLLLLFLDWLPLSVIGVVIVFQVQVPTESDGQRDGRKKVSNSVLTFVSSLVLGKEYETKSSRWQIDPSVATLVTKCMWLFWHKVNPEQVSPKRYKRRALRYRIL